jgi:hypothetical protein
VTQQCTLSAGIARSNATALPVRIEIANRYPLNR